MRLKNKIVAVVSSAKAKKIAAASLLIAVSGAAMAAGDDPGLDAITELATKAGLYIAAAAATAAVVAGGFWAIGMMKKTFSRAG